MSMWMIRAPDYSYRTHSFISKNMSRTDGCRICQILEREPPLVDTGQCRIIRTKFRSSPEHVMVAPKEHFQGLQEIKSIDTAKELISDVKRILDRRKHLIAFGLYGLAAGQTMPHLHIHVMSPDPVNISTSVKISDRLRFNDSLSEIILFNAGYPISKRRMPCIEIGLNKLDQKADKFRAFAEVFHSWNRMSEAFEKMKKGKYLIPEYYAGNAAAKRRQIDWLLANRATAGLGMIWCILFEKEYVFRIMPKATVIDPNDLTKTLGAPEMMFNIKISKTGIPKEDEKEWDIQTSAFHSEIREIFKKP